MWYLPQADKKRFTWTILTVRFIAYLKTGSSIQQKTSFPVWEDRQV